jgi:hypothetical protein
MQRQIKVPEHNERIIIDQIKFNMLHLYNDEPNNKWLVVRDGKGEPISSLIQLLIKKQPPDNVKIESKIINISTFESDINNWKRTDYDRKYILSEEWILDKYFSNDSDYTSLLHDYLFIIHPVLMDKIRYEKKYYFNLFKKNNNFIFLNEDIVSIHANNYTPFFLSHSYYPDFSVHFDRELINKLKLNGLFIEKFKEIIAQYLNKSNNKDINPNILDNLEFANFSIIFQRIINQNEFETGMEELFDIIDSMIGTHKENEKWQSSTGLDEY